MRQRQGIIRGMSDNDHSDYTPAFNNKFAAAELAPDDFDLVVDPDTSKIWLLHGKPLLNQETVTRAEYDAIDHSLCFVSHDGNIQRLGAAVQEPLQAHILKADEITGFLVNKDGDIESFFSVPLHIKNI